MPDLLYTDPYLKPLVRGKRAHLTPHKEAIHTLSHVANLNLHLHEEHQTDTLHVSVRRRSLL